jgi:hypothetical protein
LVHTGICSRHTWITGWWLSHLEPPTPSEKYESVGIMTFPIYGKIMKNMEK